MVENIYGRKTYPQTKYQERAFLQSYVFPVQHRRISGEPPNLRTIAETDDDNDDDRPSQTFSMLPSIHSNLGATGLNVPSGRKPRAISLPTIYRDGPYLRINFPAHARTEGTRTRRFSEPAVSWNSKFLSPIVSVSNDKKQCNDKVSCVARTRDVALRSREVTFQTQKFQIEKRRHSDPLIYSSEIIQKFENFGTDNQKNKQDSKAKSDVENSTTSCGENDGTELSQQPEHFTPAVQTRRRKSSLVPIPFSIVKSCSSRKQKAPSKRRLSFPLGKNEEELTKNLPTLHKLAWVDNNVDRYTSSNESLRSVEYLMQKDGLKEDINPPEIEDIPEKKQSCEEIITQWMKFFG